MTVENAKFLKRLNANDVEVVIEFSSTWALK